MEEGSVHSSTSDINSEEPARSEPLIIPRKKRICLVGEAGEDPALGAAAQQFSVPVLKSETGAEYMEDTAYCTYFILKQFEGPEYEGLSKSAHRILGPTALLQLADKKASLPSINRPMYTQAMVGIVVAFTGFRKKDELTRLINMIHSMGGSIRKEMGGKVTHLLANCCGGDKYRYAVTFRVPIMSISWVTTLWEAKDDVASYGSNDELVATQKLKPFFGAKVCFFGFPDDEKKHMCEVLQQQGGESTEIDDPNCTHVVTDSDNRYRDVGNYMGPRIPSRMYSLKTEPFTFTFYDPYTNTIPSKTSDHSGSISRSASVQYHPYISRYTNDNIARRFSVASDLSLDSGISMDFTKSEDADFPFDCFSNQYDSGVNISSSTRMSQDITGSRLNSLNSGSANSGLIVTSTELDLASIVSSKMDVDTSEPSRSFDLRMSKLKNVRSMSLPVSQLIQTESKVPVITSQYSKDDQTNKSPASKTIQSNKKAVTPRRYVIWKRSKSCFAVTKFTSPDKTRSVKIFSQPNLCRHREDLLLYGSPILRTKRNFSTALRQIFKSDETNHTSDSKQYVHMSPEGKRSQSNSASIPAKIARMSTDSKKTSNASTSLDRTQNQTSGFDKTKKSQEKSFIVVVDESNVNALPDLASVRAHIVKAEWFWTSVQNEGAADEKEYLFEDYLESVLSPTASARRDSQQAATPSTASTRRKRKRLAETLSSLVQNGADSPAVHKRRSSISDAGHLSVSGSFLDCTASPDKQLLDEVEAVNTETSRKNLSPRHQVFLELVQTESNYVGILSTIMTLFKSPLEDLIETTGELLNSTEAKIIFGNFPPIYEVHKKMLEELRYSASRWAEDVSIGNIFLKYAPDLVKAYPPYVNFFENTKEMLDQCDQNKPRFHAFLKICQTKPECGRQSLKELLIKPVQRLPSISLLLNDILKHTNKNNPDHSALELSISSIKEVMTYINEDKRKTEGQLVMFDIFNEIDNCPPHLVSSHRSFIGKCDVMEMGEALSGRGDHLVLFLFTDTLEICKKRSKAFNSLKSPNTANGLHSAKLSQGKPYKHIRMLSLSTIKKVVDIRETDECHKVFALMVRSNQELKEKMFSFTITDEEVNKTNYLRTLCRQMANTVCKADADTFLITLDSNQLEIDTSDIALGTLSKAFKSLFHNFYLEYMDPYVFLLNSMCETTLHVPLPFASRTRMKVGRAFSFNKTPSKLKRAMSTMMSPFGSTNSLTPASQQLAQMRLASCNNINELGNGGSGSPSRDDVLVAPMSVQPTRKAKCSSLSMASLRRNCSEEVVQDKSEL
ncbi:protein ECT2 isoform X3 [Cephus cinctus]|uniref:Protein ECT2 isoform X3 n=1 Tax=Cephus cinctus TaxID=211228 RepID=A0AAJ7C822_CEPCN|nr:protein ECT2 isoform X3 [Cephus cinctus]